MDFNALIQQGWKDHASHPAAVAALIADVLPGSATEAAALLGLGNHVLGEHLHDWPAALALAERVAAPFQQDFLPSGEETPGMAQLLSALIVAQTLNNDVGSAFVNQHRLQALSAEQAPLRQLKLSTQLPSPMIRAGRFAEGAALFRGLLLPARQQNDASVQRTLAIASNNLASALLEIPQRNADETALMQEAARVAQEFWQRCGTWENHERALYLLGLVANASGQPHEALAHAENALAIIANNGEEPVDEAFLLLVEAHAYRLLGEEVRHAQALHAAQVRADGFEDEGLVAWFQDERGRALAAAAGA